MKRGEVTLEKDVVEEPRSVDVNVAHDEISIERRPVLDDNTAAGDIAFDENDGTIRIPVTEEQVEVTKKPVVTEEIVVKKHRVEDQETVHDTVKREEVDIDRDGEVDVRSGDLDNKRF